VAKQPIHALKLDVRDFQDVLSLDFELVKGMIRYVLSTVNVAFVV
jgi:hypothetical protein